MHLTTNMTGRKIIMSITGLAMAAFVLLHLMGNASMFKGPDSINAYSDILQGLGPLLWLARLVMLAVFVLHVFFGITLTLENRAAKPLKYAAGKSLSTTAAGRSMIWTGLLTATYLAYHLLHFTLQVISPETSAGLNHDAMERPDVFSMVVLGFSQPVISGIYILSMASLALHLSHGMQSMFQSLGLNSEESLPVMIRAATATAVLIFIGYAAIPVSIMAGIIRR